MTKITTFKCDVCGDEHVLKGGRSTPAEIRHVIVTIAEHTSYNHNSPSIVKVERIWCIKCLEKANIPHSKETSLPEEVSIENLIVNIVNQTLDERD